MKNPFKSKTVWFAILQAIAGIVTVIIANDPALQSVAAIAIFKSALDITLRAMTTEPIG